MSDKRCAAGAEALDEYWRMPKTAEPLCFFGVGVLFDACYDQLVLAAGQRPDVLSDNAATKWGKSFHGVRCLPPEQIPGKATIVLCIRNYEAVSAQLRALGHQRIYLANFDRGYHRVSRLRRLDTDAAATPAPPPLDLHGQWALVTGASRGIGQQIAAALAQRGLNLICHGKTEESARMACESVGATGVETSPIAADLADPQALDRLCDWLAGSAPPLALLYNNAGISPACPDGFWKMGSTDFADCYAINAIAPIRISQAIIPKMKIQGFGRVINLSSSIQHRPDEMAYACSKAALDKFVYDIAPHLEGSGVMVSLLDPGWLRTDMGGSAAPHAVDSVLPGALLGAFIDADVNGRWFSAQDYCGLSMEAAIRKAFFIDACSQPIRIGPTP